MKLSKVIAKLNVIYEEYGDIESDLRIFSGRLEQQTSIKAENITVSCKKTNPIVTFRF